MTHTKYLINAYKCLLKLLVLLEPLLSTILRLDLIVCFLSYYLIFVEQITSMVIDTINELNHWSRLGYCKIFSHTDYLILEHWVTSLDFFPWKVDHNVHLSDTTTFMQRQQNLKISRFIAKVKCPDGLKQSVQHNKM